jgi:hypothetical protein
MIAVKKSEPKPCVRRTPLSRGASSAKPLFWRLASHPDNDRAGDFLLKNLEAIREESSSRGDPR